MESRPIFVAVIAAALSVGVCVCARFSEDARDPVYRLPSTVTPIKYSLLLEPNLDSYTVTGQVVIRLQTTTDTSTTESMNYITLHLGEDSEIDESTVSLKPLQGPAATNVSVRYYNSDAMVQIVLPQGQNLNFSTKYVLTMNFTSPLYNDSKGLFVGTYPDNSVYVASNFRATYARNVFPCFDEPQYQVPLTLQVVRDTAFSVAFTTPRKTSKSYNGKFMDTFKPTSGVSLSSLGLFMSQVAPVPSDMGVTLYAPAGYNTTVDYLNTLITGITTTLGSFPVPLNLVILPDRIYTSFASLGFVFTTPEVYYGEVPAQLQWMSLRQQLAEAFLQQYFAFTKTPSWWSDLWLSDSISAYLAIEMLPQSSLEGLQITEIRSNGFNSDNLNCSGPVVNSQILSRMDIETAINNHTIKNKGFSILTMWKDTLPEGLVDKTIIDYSKLDIKSTSTEDFLKLLVLNIEANLSYNATAAIDNLLNWLYSPGNPVVTIQPKDDSEIVLTQSSSCFNTAAPNFIPWPISISYTNETSKNWTYIRQNLWLTGNHLTILTNGSGCTIFNLENAPYRVNYNSSYKQILHALRLENSSSIPASVRATIQSDAVDLAISDSLDFATALSVMNYTQHSQVDWIPVSKALSTLTALIGTNGRGLAEFSMYAETLFSSELLAALDLRYSAKNRDQWLARSLLTPWLCRFNFSTCQQTVQQLGELILEKGFTDEIDPNDVDNIVCLGARYNTSAFDTILAGFASSTNLTSKRLFTLALGCVVDSDSVEKILNIINGSLSSSNQSFSLKAESNSVSFSLRDTRDVLVGLASSKENSDKILEFITLQAESLQNVMGSRYLSDVIKTLGKSRANLTALQTLEDADFLDAYIKESIVETMAEVNYSSTVWSARGESFMSALPQLPTTESSSTSTTTATTTTLLSTTTTAATSTTSTKAPVTTTAAPSSATALPFLRTQLLSLVGAAISMILSIS